MKMKKRWLYLGVLLILAGIMFWDKGKKDNFVVSTEARPPKRSTSKALEPTVAAGTERTQELRPENLGESSPRSYSIPFIIYEGDLKSGQEKVGRLSLSVLGTWMRDSIDGELEITEFDTENGERQKLRITRDQMENFLEPKDHGARFYVFPSDDDSTLFRLKRSGSTIVGTLYRAQDAEGMKYESSFILRPAPWLTQTSKP